MKRSAQNLMEITLLVCVVVLVTVSVITIYNNQKTRLAQLSKTNASSHASEVIKNAQPEDIVPYRPTETAGSNALSMLKPPLTLDQYNAYMANITYGKLKEAMDAPEGEEDLADLANEIIKSLNLPYDEISPDKIDMNTLATLTGVLNGIADSADTVENSVATAYVDKLGALLESVKSSFK